MVQVVGIDESMIRECTCKNCSRRLRYTNSEVQERRTKDYTGCVDLDYVIVCPVCMNNIPVKKVYTS